MLAGRQSNTRKRKKLRSKGTKTFNWVKSILFKSQKKLKVKPVKKARQKAPVNRRAPDTAVFRYVPDAHDLCFSNE
jgi:hypothetical protein